MVIVEFNDTPENILLFKSKGHHFNQFLREYKDSVLIVDYCKDLRDLNSDLLVLLNDNRWGINFTRDMLKYNKLLHRWI